MQSIITQKQVPIPLFNVARLTGNTVHHNTQNNPRKQVLTYINSLLLSDLASDDSVAVDVDQRDEGVDEMEDEALSHRLRVLPGSVAGNEVRDQTCKNVHMERRWRGSRWERRPNTSLAVC